MQMTNEEIVRDYSAAANKCKQIRILADLNAVSPSEIRAVLAQAGVEGVEAPKRIRPRNPEDHILTVKAAPPVSQAAAVYDRIETILTALPEDASASVRDTAKDLIFALFQEYVENRLGLEGQ